MGQTQTASSKAENYTWGAEIDHLAPPPRTLSGPTSSRPRPTAPRPLRRGHCPT